MSSSWKEPTNFARGVEIGHAMAEADRQSMRLGRVSLVEMNDGSLEILTAGQAKLNSADIKRKLATYSYGRETFSVFPKED